MEQQKLPSFNIFNGKIYTYGSKGVLRTSWYRDDPNPGQGIVPVRIIP